MSSSPVALRDRQCKLQVPDVVIGFPYPFLHYRFALIIESVGYLFLGTPRISRFAEISAKCAYLVVRSGRGTVVKLLLVFVRISIIISL